MVKTQVQNKFHEYISLYWTIKFWTVQFFFTFLLWSMWGMNKKLADLKWLTSHSRSPSLACPGSFHTMDPFFFTMGTELLNSCFKFSQISLVWKASGGLKKSTDPKPEGTAWEEKKQNIFPGLVPCEFITRVGTVNMWFYCNMRCLKRDFQFVVRHHFYIILISIITKRNLFKIFLLTDDKLLSITQNGGANLALNLDPKFMEAEVQLSWEREREKRGVAKSPGVSYLWHGLGSHGHICSTVWVSWKRDGDIISTFTREQPSIHLKAPGGQSPAQTHAAALLCAHANTHRSSN